MHNEIVKMEIENNRILVTYEDGKRTFFGEVHTERGAKMMFKRRAKNHNLKIINPTTAIRQ